MTGRLQQLLIAGFDYYAQRTTERMAGLTDDEYHWEPVAGLTTLPWRLGHVVYCLQQHALRPVAFERGRGDWREPGAAPANAADALTALDGAIAAWKRDLVSVDDDRLWEPLGEEAGPYGADSVAAFVEHIHDEFIHHSAEMALLRDLYQCSASGPTFRP